MTRDKVEELYGKTWNTKELQENFEILGFSLGCCVARNKTTNERGSLEFNRFDIEGEGAVRLYYGFVKG